jgi:type I restriction enzyme M protein
MLGAIIGDIIGSVYEWNNIKTKEFELFKSQCFFTDDSVMTCANAVAAMKYKALQERTPLSELLVPEMKRLGRKYPDAGYGGRFFQWLFSDETKAYGSFGNGAAMRVSPVAWIAASLEETETLAKQSAEVTHNHPEGIRGAQAVASAIYLARSGQTKQEIKAFIEGKYYRLNFKLDDIRDNYRFDVTCQGSVPQAIEAFLEAAGFEDAIRNAISIGGDSDTLGAITGSIAEGFYGIPPVIKEKAMTFLDDELAGIVERFYQRS